MNEQPRRNNLWRLLGSVLILLIAAVIFVYRQPLLDRYMAWTYHAPTEIVAIADHTKLSEKGRFYLYASQPKIEDRASFNNHCTQRDEKTAILGCYVGMRIYLFDVSDDRLDGIKEVTAAHEMLHAAYDRLSSAERTRVNSLVETQLASVQDERIKELVVLYEKTEPGERANELHSILGTELDTLSPELEAYYKQYFTDRQAVVAMSKRYEAVFSQINDEQNALVAELNKLAADISTQSSTYNDDTTHLNSDIAAFNRKANSGGFSSQSEFDSQRQVLVAKQTALQQARTTLNAMIADYNTKRARLETLNGQAEDLNRSINSQLSPVPSI